MAEAAERAEPGSDESDRSLVERFLAERGETPFHELYGRHTPALYRIAWRSLAGVPGAAEDAVQETWIRAVRGLGAFRWESSLRTWLVGILLRCCREQWRRRPQREPAGPHAVARDAVDAPRPDDRIALERAVAALAPVPRQVLVLHDVEGYTHEEIGALLGMPPGTAKSHLHRARRRLIARLRDDGRRDERGA
jgi:RNA polymerase sigma-70 factor (ECF subfamily)